MNNPLIIGAVPIKSQGLKIVIKERTDPPILESSQRLEQPVATKKRNRKIRPVSFNLDDPLERRMNEHADLYSCYSSYIKRLIQRDMEAGNTVPGTSPLPG